MSVSEHVKLAGIFSRFAKTEALTRYIPQAEHLLGEEAAQHAATSYMGRKALRGAAEGGIGGGLAGAGVGVYNRAHTEEGQPKPSILHSAIAGGVMGAGAGAITRYGIAGHKANKALHGYYDNANKIFKKDPVSKKYLVTHHHDKDVFSHPDVQAHVLHDDFKIEKPRMFNMPDIKFNKTTGRMEQVARGPEYMSRAEKEQVLHGLANPKPATSFADTLADSRTGRGEARAQMQNRVYGRLAQEMEKGEAKPGMSKVLERLKSEGINNHRDFVTKYHPDRNTNIPKDVKEHFGGIVEHLRNRPTAEVAASPMDRFAQGFKARQGEHVRNANQAVYNLGK